jgi:hypothetical protein
MRRRFLSRVLLVVLASWVMAGCRARYLGSYYEPDADLTDDDGGGGQSSLDAAFDARDAGEGAASVQDAPTEADTRGDEDGSSDALDDARPDAIADGSLEDRAADARVADADARVADADAGDVQAEADADTCPNVTLPAPGLEYTFDDCKDTSTVLHDTGPSRLDAEKKGNIRCVGGRSGVAVYFSGDNTPGLSEYLNVPGIDPQRFTQAFTLSAWVSLSSGAYSNIIGRWYLDDSFLLVLDEATSSFAFTVVHPSSDGGSSNFSVRAPLVLYKWVHIVVVFDGSSSTIYENGVATESIHFDRMGPIATTMRDLQMGGLLNKDGLPGGGFMNGLLDDVRLYDVALTQDQVRALYCR